MEPQATGTQHAVAPLGVLSLGPRGEACLLGPVLSPSPVSRSGTNAPAILHMHPTAGLQRVRVPSPENPCHSSCSLPA